MLQEHQQYMEAPKISPDDLTPQHSLISSYIIRPEQLNIEEDLITEYADFREKKVQTSCLSLIKSKINNYCGYTLVVMRQLWRQLIPSVVSGAINQNNIHEFQRDMSKDAIFFQQYFKKKSRFFLIVFDYQSQELMQEAYQKASFIVTEGRGIRISEINKNTNCRQWKIQGWTKLKHYSILFFKFDMFGNLRNFGHLSKQLIDAFDDDESFPTNFKNHLNEAYEKFEAMEKQFTNSYLEKEDRMHFQLFQISLKLMTQQIKVNFTFSNTNKMAL